MKTRRGSSTPASSAPARRRATLPARPARDLEREIEDVLSLRNFAATVTAELPYVLDESTKEGQARGRFGRKVFIAALWRALQTHPRLRDLSLPEFKRRLYEAHRARLLTLARADFVQAMAPDEVAASEHDVGGAVFHLVVGDD